jgi:DNA-binding transcriptional ArsR family regulator
VAAAITDEHPADLIEQAEALEAQAEIEMLSVRKLRAEAAKLRARAERINTCTSVTVTRKPPPDDPLLGAAALAVEDIRGLLVRLRDMGHLEQLDGRFRSVDPEVARIRDAVIELNEFTREQLAERVGLRPEALSWYLADLRTRGIITGDDDETMAYEPPGRENVVSRRRRRRTPEQEVIDPDIAAGRGHVVELTGKPMIETGGNRRRAGSRKSRGGAVRKKKTRGI